MPGSYSSTPGRRVPSIQIFMLPVAYSTTCLPCTLPSNSTAIFNYIALFLCAVTILSFPLSKCFLLLPSAPLFIACFLFVYLFHFVSLFPSSSLPFFFYVLLQLYSFIFAVSLFFFLSLFISLFTSSSRVIYLFVSFTFIPFSFIILSLSL